MGAIVKELQRDVLTPTVSVTNLLLKAKVIASKLKLDDMLAWIESELNGYDSTEKDLPAYRIVSGQLRALNPVRGWQTIIIEDKKVHELVSKKGVIQPIGEVENLVKEGKVDGSYYLPLGPEARNTIAKAIDFETEINFFTQHSELKGIIDGVRNAVLSWSLKLEDMGIVGHDLDFTEEDKEKASSPQVQYTINNIENFSGTIGNATNTNSTFVANISAEKVLGLVEQIRKFAPDIELPENKKRELDSNLQELEKTVKTDPKSSKIGKLLKATREILINAAGNIAAHGAIALIDKLI